MHIRSGRTGAEVVGWLQADQGSEAYHALGWLGLQQEHGVFVVREHDHGLAWLIDDDGWNEDLPVDVRFTKRGPIFDNRDYDKDRLGAVLGRSPIAARAPLICRGRIGLIKLLAPAGNNFSSYLQAFTGQARTEILIRVLVFRWTIESVWLRLCTLTVRHRKMLRRCISSSSLLPLSMWAAGEAGHATMYDSKKLQRLLTLKQPGTCILWWNDSYCRRTYTRTIIQSVTEL